MKKITFTLSLSALLLPFVVSAQSLLPLRNLINSVNILFATLIPLLITIALAAFFYGLIRYIMKSGNAKEAKNGKSIMIAGLVALFVMVSVWGIVALGQNSFGITGHETPTVPVVPISR